MVMGASLPALAPVSARAAAESCAAFVARDAGVSADLASIACDAFDRQTLEAGLTEVPTLLMAWPGVGVTKDGGGVGFPVSAVCVLGGAFVDPDNVQYVVAGSAQSVGPAVETRVACGAGPFFTEGELIGPIAVAATTGTASLQAMSVCTVGRGTFLDGSITRTREPAGCSPRPSIPI
jgi:hypothetical protein